MSENMGCSSLDAKVEATFNIIRLEKTNDFYGCDCEARRFLIHFENYINDRAGTKESVTKDLIPKLSQYHKTYGVGPDINFFRSVNILSTAATSFFTVFGLYTANKLAKLSDPSDKKQLTSLLLLELAVATVGAIGYFWSKKGLKKYQQKKDKLGNPVNNKDDKKLWEDAVQEIHDNFEYRERAKIYLNHEE